jgi:undecaprenyl diphosphate synthase
VIAANYGGRWDIVNACKQAIANGVDADALSEQIWQTWINSRGGL